MKNLFNTAILTLATTLALTACGGGSSDSSGIPQPPRWMQEHNYEFGFRHLPTCQVDRASKIIYASRNDKAVPISPITGKPNRRLTSLIPEECKVKLPEVNGGLTFSLKCERYVKADESSFSVSVNAERRHIESVNNMIKTGKPYYVACVK